LKLEVMVPINNQNSVNTPFITSFTNDSCVSPPFVQTRFGGGGFTDVALYNETTGLFRYGNYLSTAVNRCINGDCSLPGETAIVDEDCMSSVSVFTIDYDAPLGSDQNGVRLALAPLVMYEGGPPGKMSIRVRDGLKSKFSVFVNDDVADAGLLEEQLEARHPLRHE
jgi:5'-nucleotidase